MFDDLKQVLQQVITAIMTEHLQHLITVQQGIVGVA